MKKVIRRCWVKQREKYYSKSRFICMKVKTRQKSKEKPLHRNRMKLLLLQLAVTSDTVFLGFDDNCMHDF